jgi:hypothetical protein
MNPLRIDGPEGNIITPDQIKSIFSDVEVILRYNSVFLAELEGVMAVWDPTKTKLGQVFLRHVIILILLIDRLKKPDFSFIEPEITLFVRRII